MQAIGRAFKSGSAPIVDSTYLTLVFVRLRNNLGESSTSYLPFSTNCFLNFSKSFFSGSRRHTL